MQVSAAEFDKFCGFFALKCSRHKGGSVVKRGKIRKILTSASAVLMAAAMLLLLPSAPADAEGGSELLKITVATACAEFSAEGRADAEWAAYLKKYTAQQELLSRAAGQEGGAWRRDTESDLACMYRCGDDASRQRLAEIAGKYGLTLHPDCTVPDSMDALPVPTIAGGGQYEPAYRCSDGAFGFTGRVETGGWVSDFLYEETPVGTMGFWSMEGETCDKYSRWRRVLPDGAELWIDMGPYDSGTHPGFRQVILYCRDSRRIVTVRASVPNGREGAEAFAACFSISG